MKIWIDTRLHHASSLYDSFTKELVHAYITTHQQDDIVVYGETANGDEIFCEYDNVRYVQLEPKNQMFVSKKYKKRFTQEHFSYMIFFDTLIPHGYDWEVYIVIEGLKDIFFPKHSFIQKKMFSHMLKHAIKKAKKIIALDWQTALELNERLDIPEDSIEKIPGFFPTYNNTQTPLSIDVASQHNLRWPYLVYDSGNELHNNFERIIKTLKKLQDVWTTIYLLVLCEQTNTDLDIRNMVLEYDISQQVLFLWPVSKELESSYYTQSAGVIFSSIYESFPLHFYKALTYNVPIFANEIPANKEVMGDTITYLDPLSLHNILDTLTEKIAKKQPVDYKHIRETYSATHSAQILSNIIEQKNRLLD